MEWIMIFGFVALVMVIVVLITALLYVFTRHKTNTPQNYNQQQYSQQPPPQYSHSANIICPQCGLSMASNIKFCSNCGKQLN